MKALTTALRVAAAAAALAFAAPRATAQLSLDFYPADQEVYPGQTIYYSMWMYNGSDLPLYILGFNDGLVAPGVTTDPQPFYDFMSSLPEPNVLQPYEWVDLTAFSLTADPDAPEGYYIPAGEVFYAEIGGFEQLSAGQSWSVIVWGRRDDQNPVPEPGAAALMAGAVAPIVWLAWRRRGARARV